MSGSQIGTVLGGIVGAFFGAPQLGMAIGGLIGGLVDPQKIKGPRIGDGQTQTATDGIPIAWVVGGTATVAGTIVQASQRRHVQVKVSGGKGGPPKQYQDELFQDFCILVCESCSLRDSTMQAVLMVQQDGQIVYDTRPGTSDAMVASSAKWKKNVTFQFGDESQMPHPTMEAITGVGNTPAYRGQLTAIFTNINLTNSGNRIPTFLFTVASAAVLTTQGAVLPLQTVNTTSSTGFFSYVVPVGYQQTVLFDLPTSQFIVDGSKWAISRFIVEPLFGSEPNGIKTFSEAEMPGAVNTVGTFDSGWLSYAPGYFVPGDTLWNEWAAWWASIGRPTPGLDYSIPSIIPGMPYTYSGARMATGVRITVLYFSSAAFTFAVPTASIEIPDGSSHALTALSLQNYIDGSGNYYTPSWFPTLVRNTAAPGTILLSDIVSRMCKRGGLTAAEINVADLVSIDVLGYPIAKQASATDCLGPILAAFFSYGSEYDARINFLRYGANVVLEVMRADLLEANGANQDAVIRTPRNQATEFPRRIVGSYVDPAQNYNSANVAVSRSSINVIAIGEQQLPIPVTMTATQAVQAVDKALKVAYATLEGNIEYSLTDAYLALCAGDPVAFQGKRYVIDDIVLGNGHLKLVTRYDRQSAYTSTVQPVPGNAPTPPNSPYSGPSYLVAMNLPSLRPQDTHGIYLAASPAFSASSWRGCIVQVSYDNQVSWQTCATIGNASTMGMLTVAEPVGHEPLTVAVNADLQSVTLAQLGARMNAFALLDSSGPSANAEIGQFQTATETTPDTFQLTGVNRGALGTRRNVGVVSDPFVMLDAVTFVPVDLTFTGRKVYFRTIGFGEASPDAPVAIVYTPNTNHIVGFETTDTGAAITTSSGSYLEVTGT